MFARYTLLAMKQCQNEEQRTLGELFFFLVDEMADITFRRSLGILMDALMVSLQEILKLSDAQLTALLPILKQDCGNICEMRSIQRL